LSVALIVVAIQAEDVAQVRARRNPVKVGPDDTLAAVVLDLLTAVLLVGEEQRERLVGRAGLDSLGLPRKRAK